MIGSAFQCYSPDFSQPGLRQILLAIWFPLFLRAATHNYIFFRLNCWRGTARWEHVSCAHFPHCIVTPAAESRPRLREWNQNFDRVHRWQSIRTWVDHSAHCAFIRHKALTIYVATDDVNLAAWCCLRRLCAHNATPLGYHADADQDQTAATRRMVIYAAPTCNLMESKTIFNPLRGLQRLNIEYISNCLPCRCHHGNPNSTSSSSSLSDSDSSF